MAIAAGAFISATPSSVPVRLSHILRYHMIAQDIRTTFAIPYLNNNFCISEVYLTVTRIPDHIAAYAIGDIHGCPWLLDRVVNWIRCHAAQHSHDRRVIIVLGDMIDRGPDSKGVVEKLIGGPPSGFEFVCLRGNHEQLMLNTLSDGRGLDLWIANGGRMTLESYGVDHHMLMSCQSERVVRDTLHAAIPPPHQRFLRDLTLSYQLGEYLFVHAGIRPGSPVANQCADDMMWIREEFTGSAADFGLHVVHGHTVTRDPDERGNATGLDTGAVISGRLSCMALWSNQREIYTTPGFNK